MEVNLIGGQVPLLEFDSDRIAVLEPAESAKHWTKSLASDAAGAQAASGIHRYRCPQALPTAEAPVAAVACFFREIVAKRSATAPVVMQLPSGEPLVETVHNGRRVALFYPGIGAALASYSLELAIAAGCRSIVACGGAGALQPDLPVAHAIITVTSAIRDEGTSYHYLPPSREVLANPHVAQLLCDTVRRQGLPHLAGRTWTTDGILRETPGRVARRRSEGCLTVEMEAAAMIAVSTFRGAKFGQFLYAGDDLSGEAWAAREWKNAHEMRELMVDLAADAALRAADDLND